MTTDELRALKHVRSYGIGGYYIGWHNTSEMASVLWNLAFAGYLDRPEHMRLTGWDNWLILGDTPLCGTVALTEKGEEALKQDG